MPDIPTNMATVCDVSKTDDSWKGSDADNAQYYPVVLKTIKSGIDTVTSIAFGIDSNIGYYSLVCYSNQQLSAFTQNGDFLKNIVFSSFQTCAGYHIHDIVWIQPEREPEGDDDEKKKEMFMLILLSAANSKYFYFFDFESEIFSNYLTKSTTVEDNFEIIDITEAIGNQLTTGLCILKATEEKFIVAISCADRQSYDINPRSRRYIGIFEKDFSNSISLIEYKDLNKKERLFIYPKRLAKSSIGDLWVIDRKSSRNGDVKVFEISEDCRISTFLFTYSGDAGSKFDPMDVKASQEVMVISDCSNHRVHLVKNDGTFLMHVMDAEQGLQYPRALCVDVFDRIWVGCNDGTVHILKYRTKFEA